MPLTISAKSPRRMMSGTARTAEDLWYDAKLGRRSPRSIRPPEFAAPRNSWETSDGGVQPPDEPTAEKSPVNPKAPRILVAGRSGKEGPLNPRARRASRDPVFGDVDDLPRTGDGRSPDAAQHRQRGTGASHAVSGQFGRRDRHSATSHAFLSGQLIRAWAIPRSANRPL